MSLASPWWIAALLACGSSPGAGGSHDSGSVDTGEAPVGSSEIQPWTVDTGLVSCGIDFAACDVTCDGFTDTDVVLVRQPDGAELMFSDLPAAAVAARDGATIQLCPGSYDASVWIDADVSLRAWDSGTRPELWGTVDDAAVLTVTEGHTVQIFGVRISADCEDLVPGGSGGGPFGGSGTGWDRRCAASTGIEVRAGADVQVLHSGIRDQPMGGIVAHDPARLELSHVVVADNVGSLGAGLFVQGGTTILSDTSFERNQAFGAGGGIHADLCEAPLLADDVRLVDNAALDGGGLYVRDCTIEVGPGGLDVEANSADLAGGGVFLRTSSLTGADHRLAFNTASQGAGAAVLGEGAVGPGRIEGNVAVGEGGGVYVDATSPVVIEAELSNNTAAAGGGVYVQSGDTVVRSPLVWDNAALAGQGGGASVAGGRLMVTEGDWGTDAAGTDNVPADVMPLDGVDAAVYDTGVCFECTAASCDSCP